jgi:hypothetical protein
MFYGLNMIRKYVVFPVYLSLKTFLKNITFWEVMLFRLMFNRTMLHPHADGGSRVL